MAALLSSCHHHMLCPPMDRGGRATQDLEPEENAVATAVFSLRDPCFSHS